MDQQTALELVTKGASLLLLDVPQLTLVGIDTKMFSVGPLFKGIKMIPPGPHFIYYSSANRDGSEFSPVISFFIFTSLSEVFVLKWNPQEEHLVRLSEEEEGRYSQAAKNMEFDRNLAPYALEHFGEWKQISNFITKQTIDRLEPLGKEISVAYEANLINTVHATPAEKKLAEQLRNSRFSESPSESPMRGCYYVSVPTLVKHKGVTQEELTALNLDKTKLLENLLAKEFGGMEDALLGEMQFAFVAFLMGQSLQAFYQWKALISLMFSCTEAPLETRTRLFIKFLKVIYHQLKHGFQTNNGASRGDAVSLSLDDSWISKDGFLNHHCKNFFSLIEQSPVVDGDLLSWTRKLKHLLERELGWELQEGDEYSPVVVLTDEP